jgi:undecaprenyl diphosphate synthase
MAAGTSPRPQSWLRAASHHRASLDRAMALAHVPDPDLLIRTGGEQRISNFLLWQAPTPSCFQRPPVA